LASAALAAAGSSMPSKNARVIHPIAFWFVTNRQCMFLSEEFFWNVDLTP
jgi:hypothetical protein